jgi:fluoroquinolone transport system permease protein
VGQTFKLFRLGLAQIQKDGILLVLLALPLCLGLPVKFLLPQADRVWPFGFSLAPWYAPAEAFLLALGPCVTAILCAFLLLDEREEGTGAYYRITPAAGRAYLAARLGLPMLWAFAVDVCMGLLFFLTAPRPLLLLAAAFLAAAGALAYGLMIAALASGRVEGLVVAKLNNLCVLSAFVPWFVPAPQTWFAAFLPSFWVGAFYRWGTPELFAGGLAVCGVWCGVFGRKFLRGMG